MNAEQPTIETIGNATLILRDCIAAMRDMPDCSIDSIVTDPPYELGFMGKSWDSTGVAFSLDVWREALRVLKPGGHLLAFSGSRTYHRMAVAIEDAGFEIRDSVLWLYGSGFPKSLDVSKAIDKAAGATREVVGTNPNYRDAAANAEHHAKWNGAVMSQDVTAPATDAARQWEGWGTALKPAHEPICMARKPLSEKTVAANVLAHGTGALNIDASRVQSAESVTIKRSNNHGAQGGSNGWGAHRESQNGEPWTAHESTQGRWPANVIHDGSPEVVEGFPVTASGKNAEGTLGRRAGGFGDVGAEKGDGRPNGLMYGDKGSAARFFYCAKASKADRGEGNTHPTVKPTDLMRYLIALVTQPGGVVLDPFMGSGSTGKAAAIDGFQFVGIDVTPEYVSIARSRIQQIHAGAPLLAQDAA